MKKNKKKKTNKTEAWIEDHKGRIGFFAVIILPIFIYLLSSISDKTEKPINNEIKIDINNENTINNPTVKGVEMINNCDSDFNDGKWVKDGWWEKDKQKFTYKTDELGGPKMVFSEKKSSNNFLSSFEFMPVENIDNKDKEINLVVYIGDLYKVVFEKIYKKDWKNETESFDSFYVAYVKDDNKVPEYGTGAKKIELKNNISFDKWSKMKIVQESTEGLSDKTVTVEIFYFPDRIKNSPEDHEKHVFNIEDISSSGTLQRDIKIGLQIGEKKSTFITEFNCFKLTNR
ncbi:MAG: hypothetical protein KAR54_03080 [Candidatus Pacebacteria bacterium]|nr:hypothetical protein [Candidatus Paceibacterota bacterium]